VPKNRFQPSAGRSAGTEHRLAPRWPHPPPSHHSPRKRSPRRPVAASSSCRSGSDEPQTRSPARRSFGAASATLALNPALCFFRVRFMSCSRAIRALLGAGLHLSHLSHFRGPAQFAFAKIRYRGLTKNTHRLLRHLRPGQSVHRASASIALPRGVSFPQSGRSTLETPLYGPNPPHFPVLCPVAKSPCIPSLPQPFIQTFP
jgi:hypothetical protein